eukprot:COSAG05_NODE_284_length_12237_cov_15.252266_6_plen_70_part_00
MAPCIARLVHARYRVNDIIHLRVRLKIIGSLEIMHDPYLPTFLIVSLPIIFKRTVLLYLATVDLTWTPH